MSQGPAPGTDIVPALRAVTGGLARAFVAPEHRVLFISVNKNACTSLKWMMAGLIGDDLGGFAGDLMPFATLDEVVHDRSRWSRRSRLGKLDREVRACIHPENGWFVFGVVRDPRLRFFSAWQNKVLLQSPITSGWRRQPWFPRHPVTEATIVEDFARFTAFMADNPGTRMRQDPHFQSQVALLNADVVPYSRIYEIGELGRLRSDLTAHLEAVGRPHELHLPRANHTPLRARAVLFENGVRERIEQMYAADLDEFGDLWDFDAALHASPWSAEQLAEADLVAALGHRMGDLRDIGLAERKRADEATERAERAERELRELRAAAGSGQVRRIARGVARRVRGPR